jgi:GAF domain-containing protein
MTPDREHAVTEGSDTYALVRTAMSSAVGLLNVAEAAGLAIMHAMSAWELSVTLLDGDNYWDIVDVSVDPARGTRFPNHRYPLTDFPIGTRMLLTGRGYVGGEAIDEVLVEYERQWSEVPVGSIMSAPIIALGGVHGELFLVRDTETPPFTTDELSVAAECATLLGARLPALVASYREGRPEGESAGTMDQLSRNLDALLDGRRSD